MKATKPSQRKMVLLALAGVALLAPAVHAAAIATSYGDLILGFQATGGTGASLNVEVDLGPVTNFTGNLTLSALNVQDLVDTYSASWYNRTDLKWGVVATANGTTGSLGFPANTLWATAPSGIVWTPGSSGLQASGRATIGTMIGGAALGRLNEATSTTNSDYAAVINNTLVGSWTYQDTKVAGESFSYFNPSVDSLANPGISGQVSMELYELQPGTAGLDMGTLILTADGLSFQAIPEPATGVLVVLGIGSVMLLRRTKAVRA